MKSLLAAVDLGSNSFRLQIGRVVTTGGITEIFPVDRMKETVRLAAGLRADKHLDDAAVTRAVTVLERFGERLRSFHPERVRAVATNTFRVARNVNDFLPQAEAALGFPIEIIAGREEARLIFAGVSHALPSSAERRLVIDIGGGSTEFIIGQSYEPEHMESLYMGCVSYSRQFFPGGILDAHAFKQAEFAARREVELISRTYRRAGWVEVYGSSGTAKALHGILTASGWSEQGITRRGLHKLKEVLIRAGTVPAANLQGIKASRHEVLPGGLSIMLAIFDELGIERMLPADGALRLGVLYDLLGREASQDKREDTVRLFMHRYSVDESQALRVEALASRLFHSVCPNASEELIQALKWAARLHEVGLSIAHAGYQKHSAYILEHADMPGFSRGEQQLLAKFALWHAGKLSRGVSGMTVQGQETLALFALRLATLLLRRREDWPEGEPIDLRPSQQGVQLQLDSNWLADHPLTDYSLRNEIADWNKLGLEVALDGGNP